MKRLQKAGAIAAIIQGILFVAFPAFLFLILPAAGLDTASQPNALADPGTVLPLAARSPIVAIFNLIDVPVAACLLLVALALHDRLQMDSPAAMRVCTAAGLVAAGLFLAVGMGRYSGVAYLASLYSGNPAPVETAYLAAGAVIEGVNNAAVFAFGWWALLASWVGIANGKLSRPLCYLGLLLGVTGIITFVLPVPPVLAIVWFPWLGAVLWRA